MLKYLLTKTIITIFELISRFFYLVLMMFETQQNKNLQFTRNI